MVEDVLPRIMMLLLGDAGVILLFTSVALLKDIKRELRWIRSKMEDRRGSEQPVWFDEDADG